MIFWHKTLKKCDFCAHFFEVEMTLNYLRRFIEKTLHPKVDDNEILTVSLKNFLLDENFYPEF